MFLLLSLTVVSFKLKSQPFVDIINISSQNFFSEYTDSTRSPLFIQDNFLNCFLPKKFGKGHTLLLRLNSEQLTIQRASGNDRYQFYSLSLPLGCQLVSRNQKWKYTGIVIPKINSDMKDDLSNDLQIGGIGLVTRVFNENLQMKLGLYYNCEFFGNFFMPLAGVDWKINRRLQIYGTLPSNFRFEFKLSDNWNTGVGFRSFARSFRLSNHYNNDFTWIRENQAKIFIEGFVFKNVVTTFDVFRSIGYRIPRNDNYTNSEKATPPLFANFSDHFGFTIGVAYRVMTSKNEKP